MARPMIVKVTPGTADNPDAVLVIWGADGTVLMSDHAGATAWSGPLPSTQDYYIEVVSVVQDPVSFTLDVTIPPAGEVNRPPAGDGGHVEIEFGLLHEAPSIPHTLEGIGCRHSKKAHYWI